MTNLSDLHRVDRLLFQIQLAPLQGRRFQPTGFPDLGAATFEAGNVTCLLVESAQSMANHLEATCWDQGEQRLASGLEGLSYVRVNDKSGAFMTSSVLEAHRLNSVYIEKSVLSESGGKDSLSKSIEKESGVVKDRPIDRRALVKTIFKYDVGSLLHGVFLESIDGRLRITRAMSAFIEAENVKVVASGGVKNDHVMPSTDKGEGGGEKRTSSDGYGNVPFHRDEYTAEQISLFVSIDLAQIRGYGLGQPGVDLLTTLALYRLRAMLDGGLRLRTACDFRVVDEAIKACKLEFLLPSRDDLLKLLKSAIKACEAQFAGKQGVTTVTYTG